MQNPYLRIKLRDAQTVVVTATCPSCHCTQEVTVSDEQYAAWRNGELVQNAFPNLSPDERWMFITDLCAKCFPVGEEGDE